MTKRIVQKNIRLSLEFDKYLNRNPNLYSKIPRGAWILITDKGDAAFNAANKRNVAVEKGKIVEARKEDGAWIVRNFKL